MNNSTSLKSGIGMRQLGEQQNILRLDNDVPRPIGGAPNPITLRATIKEHIAMIAGGLAPSMAFKVASGAHHASLKNQGKTLQVQMKEMEGSEFNKHAQQLLEQVAKLRGKAQGPALATFVERFLKQGRNFNDEERNNIVKGVFSSLKKFKPKEDRIGVLMSMVQYPRRRTVTSDLVINRVIDELHESEKNRIYTALGENIRAVPKRRLATVLGEVARVIPLRDPEAAGRTLGGMAKGIAVFANSPGLSDSDFQDTASRFFEMLRALPTEQRTVVLTQLVQHLGPDTPRSQDLVERVLDSMAQLPQNHHRQIYLAIADHMDSVPSTKLRDVVNGLQAILMEIGSEDRADRLGRMVPALRYYATDLSRSKETAEYFSNFFFACARGLNGPNKTTLFQLAVARPKHALDLERMEGVLGGVIDQMALLSASEQRELTRALAANVEEMPSDHIMPLLARVEPILESLSAQERYETLFDFANVVCKCPNGQVENFVRGIIRQNRAHVDQPAQYQILKELEEAVRQDSAMAESCRSDCLEKARALIKDELKLL